MSSNKRKTIKDLPWHRTQLIKVKTFVGILFALLLDALLIIAVWGIRKITISIIGIDTISIKDIVLFWVIRFSEISTVIILAVYIISDIVRHLLKAYEEIKIDFFKIFFSKSH